MRNEKVFLIFDVRFGERLRALVGAAPIWIIDSAENDHVVHELWKSPDSNITTFKPQSFVELLDTVDQHHPDWKEIEVIGELLTQAASDEACTYSVGSIEATASGFLLKRQMG